MKHTIEHDLTQDEAKRAVQRAIEQYRERYAEYSPFMVWQNETQANLGFTVKGFKLSGQLELRPRAVDVELVVPLPLRLFKNIAIAAIDREVRHFIDSAHRERAQNSSLSVADSAV
jgi:hypothetical protein